MNGAGTPPSTHATVNAPPSTPTASSADEGNLSTIFRTAAMAVSQLYRESTAAQQRAYAQGYQQALKDVADTVMTSTTGVISGEVLLHWLQQRHAQLLADTKCTFS